MCKHLTASTREMLDRRFVLYNPEQCLNGPEDLVDLVCPLHGAYRVQLRRLHRMYTYRNLRPPGCPECRYSKLDGSEYLRQVKYRFRGLTRGGYWADLYPAHPAWGLLPHWTEPPL